MAWSALTDMERDDDSKLDGMAAAPAAAPDYPYGLRICLTEAELAKLGLEADCDVGDMIDIRAFARVCCISKNDGPDGANCRIELQITHMAVENEMNEETGC